MHANIVNPSDTKRNQRLNPGLQARAADGLRSDRDALAQGGAAYEMKARLSDAGVAGHAAELELELQRLRAELAAARAKLAIAADGAGGRKADDGAATVPASGMVCEAASCLLQPVGRFQPASSHHVLEWETFTLRYVYSPFRRWQVGVCMSMSTRTCTHTHTHEFIR